MSSYYNNNKMKKQVVVYIHLSIREPVDFINKYSDTLRKKNKQKLFKLYIDFIFKQGNILQFNSYQIVQEEIQNVKIA